MTSSTDPNTSLGDGQTNVVLGPRISPPLLLRVIVMEWRWILVSEGEVLILVSWTHLVRNSLVDCIALLEQTEVKPHG